MLTRRVIARLDLTGGRVASGIKFMAELDPEDPAAHARAYYELGADEILLIDHTPGEESWQPQLKALALVTAAVPIPVSFGGDIKGEAAIRALLKAGADRVYLGEIIITRPELLTQAQAIWGPQRVGAMADIKRRLGRWYVFIDGGRRSSRLDAIQWAESVADAGAGEILFTSLDTEHRQGFDLNLAHILKSTLSVGTLLAGGGTTAAHVVEAFEAGAQGVVLGGMLHNGRIRLPDVKALMIQAEIATRPVDESPPRPLPKGATPAAAKAPAAPAPPPPEPPAEAPSPSPEGEMEEALGNLWDE